MRMFFLFVLFCLLKDRLMLSKEERMRIKFELELIEWVNETRRIRRKLEKQKKYDSND